MKIWIRSINGIVWANLPVTSQGLNYFKNKTLKDEL
jgi:hypothetical protein